MQGEVLLYFYSGNSQDKPEIIESPRATAGQLYFLASLTCRAIGSPTPSIHWYKDNKLIANNNPDLSVLVFTELTLNDRGFYHCIVKLGISLMGRTCQLILLLYY